MIIKSLDNDNKLKKIYSFQDLKVINELMRAGHVNPEPIDCKHSLTWEKAYPWMASKLKEHRLVNAKFDATKGALFWGWINPSYQLIQELVDDNTTNCETIVLCTFAISPERLLISDFDEWDNLINEVKPRPNLPKLFKPNPGSDKQAVWSELNIKDLLKVTEIKELINNKEQFFTI